METENKKICFVSFISRDNKPLYIQSFGINEDNLENTNSYLKYNFLSHMALDIIASPSSISIREQQQQAEVKNLAVLLVVHDEVTVYGYESHTGLKVIIGFNNQTHLVKDNTSLRSLFVSVHKVYVKMICDPFVEDENVLQTPVFDNQIKKIVGLWNE